jgi:hypothetical protein
VGSDLACTTQQTRVNTKEYTRRKSQVLSFFVFAFSFYHTSLTAPSPTTMALIVGLPIELLECVLADLEIADISTLSRTNKDAHRDLSPRVYHSVHWCWKDDHPCPPYDLLLRKLLSKPSLSVHIRNINLQGGGIIRNDAWRDQDSAWSNCQYEWLSVIKARSIWAAGQRRRASFNIKDWRRVKSVVSGIPIHEGDVNQWLHELYRGNVDAIVALPVH